MINKIPNKNAGMRNGVYLAPFETSGYKQLLWEQLVTT
jgi:hypothetical protein